MTSVGAPSFVLSSPSVDGHENSNPVSNGCFFDDNGISSTVGPAQGKINPSTSPSSNGFFSPTLSPRRSMVDMSRSSRLDSEPGSPIAYPAIYIDQSRALLDRQRRIFDQERSLFDQERAMWETERQALYARIKDLERSSGTANGRPPDDARAPFVPWKKAASSHQAPPLPSIAEAEVNGDALTSHHTQPGAKEKFWEGGSSRLNPARVFSNPPFLDPSSQAFIPETHRAHGGPGSSSTTVNGHAHGHAMEIGQGIDISLIRDDLDGITLKSSAVPASIVSQIGSPSGSSLRPSPPIASHIRSPSEENLTKNAGHTPPTTHLDLLVNGDDGVATPTQSRPHLRLHPPSLASLSSQPAIAIDPQNASPEPELRGPLSLPTEGEAAPESSRFLEALDSKLMHEAQKVDHGTTESADGTILLPTPYMYDSTSTSTTTTSAPTSSSSTSPSSHTRENSSSAPSGVECDENAVDGSNGNSNDVRPPQQTKQQRHDQDHSLVEPEITLRLKRSMNFGSAFGQRTLGTT